MTIELLSNSSHYRIFRTKHILPMEEDTDTLINLMEEEAREGYKLQTIFYYKSELIIIFSTFV
jgi:hypothetical protein